MTLSNVPWKIAFAVLSVATIGDARETSWILSRPGSYRAASRAARRAASAARACAGGSGCPAGSTPGRCCAVLEPAVGRDVDVVAARTAGDVAGRARLLLDADHVRARGDVDRREATQAAAGIGERGVVAVRRAAVERPAAAALARREVGLGVAPLDQQVGRIAQDERRPGSPFVVSRPVPATSRPSSCWPGQPSPSVASAMAITLPAARTPG